MVDGEMITRKMEALRFLGDPYSDDEIASAASAVAGQSELDALIAYLQNLGTVRSAR
jgi:cytochrome c oxidase cbb3-type subunit 2